jgi:hypothetical protein
VHSIVYETSPRPIQRLSARGRFAGITAPMLLVIDRSRLILVVVMRVFILFIQTLVG